MLKIGFLGGLGEFGKNTAVFDQDGALLVVDCGAMFPEPDIPGIDLVIPDFSYLQENASRVVGVVLTHGHEDHIGAAPFLFKAIDAPLYATKMTHGLLARKLAEVGAEPKERIVLEPGRTFSVGPFEVEPIPVTHSIPGAVSLAIRTREGLFIHSGDFKFDQSPPDGLLTHYFRFMQLGQEGVTGLLIDSTNVEVEGVSGSEAVVAERIEPYIAEQDGRLIIALFSTNLMRIQTIYDMAHRHGRKVALFGRSIVENIKVAIDLGYLHVQSGVAVGLEEAPSLDPSEVIVLCAGSQGEPLSAMSRIAFDESRYVSICEGDTLLLSARIIPGNEKRVARIINQVYRKGGRAVTVRDDRIHVSGHAAQEELKLLASWARPRYYIPVHGEYRQLKGNAKLAQQMGYSAGNILLCETGDSLCFEQGELKGREEIPAGSLWIDGDSADPVDKVVIRDRRHLSTDGVVVPIVVIGRQSGRLESEPEIISRGYPFLEGAQEQMEEVRREIAAMVRELSHDEARDVNILKTRVKSTVKKTLKRNEAPIPLIIPVVMEV